MNVYVDIPVISPPLPLPSPLPSPPAPPPQQPTTHHPPTPQSRLESESALRREAASKLETAKGQMLATHAELQARGVECAQLPGLRRELRGLQASKAELEVGVGHGAGRL